MFVILSNTDHSVTSVVSEAHTDVFVFSSLFSSWRDTKEYADFNFVVESLLTETKKLRLAMVVISVAPDESSVVAVLVALRVGVLT